MPANTRSNLISAASKIINAATHMYNPYIHQIMHRNSKLAKHQQKRKRQKEDIPSIKKEKREKESNTIILI